MLYQFSYNSFIVLRRFYLSAPQASAVSVSSDWGGQGSAWGAGGQGIAMTKDDMEDI
ncbi:MAG: hypothetical protein JXA96_09005 [Sedimentisphaerales bacterium]|nr:hypothetical protein [Sedimentisphaerales bacterium]